MLPKTTSSAIVLTATTADLDRGVVTRDGQQTRLTSNEGKLLAYLVARANTVVPKTELLTQVWGYHPDIQTRAVDHAVARLRRKLEVDPQHPDHLMTVHGVGFRLDVPPPDRADAYDNT